MIKQCEKYCMYIYEQASVPSVQTHDIILQISRRKLNFIFIPFSILISTMLNLMNLSLLKSIPLISNSVIEMHNNKKTFNIRFKLVSKSLLAGFNYAYFIKIELATNRQCYFLSNQYHGRYPIHP